MPNIEIHGVNVDEAKVIRSIIFSRLDFVDECPSREVVVTIHLTEVEDRNGDCCPFLRIFDSDETGKRVNGIINALRDLGMDIEVVTLLLFVDKRR